MSKAVALVAGAVVLVAALLIFWVLRRQEDCSFSGWKRTVGVELEAQVKDLEAVKSKLGITDSQVREFDQLLRDYALKYDAACRDVSAVPPRMSQDQYKCVRQNMDRVLDDIRQFVQAVEAAKGLADPGTQRDIVLKSLGDLRAAHEARYRSGCASALDVNPKSLKFAPRDSERSIKIANRGNNDVTYSVDGWPDGFHPTPTSGRIMRGDTAVVSLMRTILPVPDTPRPLTFHIRSNFQDDVVVEVSVDAQNASLWPVLGEQLRARTKPDATPTVQDALQVVDGSLQDPGAVPEGTRYMLASTLLFEIRENSEASKALEQARQKNPGLTNEPPTLMLAGLLAHRRGDADGALRYFADAKQAAGASNATSTPVYDLLSGAILLDRGDSARAEVLLTAAQPRVDSNPSLSSFTARELCDDRREACTVAFNRFVTRRPATFAPMPDDSILANVKLSQKAFASGRPLAPGTYQVRLVRKTAAGSTDPDAHWVEFLQNGQVKGREIVTVIPQEKPTTPWGKAKVQTLKGHDYVRFKFDANGQYYLVHLPSDRIGS